MIVSINQPAYLPWLGYFHRIAVSERHIVLDHAQFEKNSFVNRNRVRAGEGWCWLTVPVKTRGRFGHLPLNTVEIDNTSDWRKKHWLTLRQNYARAPYFAPHAAFFEGLYAKEWTHLLDLCNAVTGYLLQAFEIHTPLQFSSALNPWAVKSELVLELCQKAGATTYLSGKLGGDYLDMESFARAGIRVCFQDYRLPTYPRRGAATVDIPLAALDLLLYCGPESRNLLLSGQGAVPNLAAPE